jgi:hypothetical protein
METGVRDREQGGDILAIPGEFLQSMRESKGGSSDSSVPRDGPFSSIFDEFGGLNLSKRELEVPELFNFEVVVGRRELPTENGIQVDGLPSDNTLPFRIWEFRAIGGVGE